MEKALKDLTNTLKKKLTELTPKMGETVEFALFIKDVVHVPKANPASLMADRIISLTSSSLKATFQEQGLLCNFKDFFDLASEFLFKPSEFQQAAMLEVKDVEIDKDNSMVEASMLEVKAVETEKDCSVVEEEPEQKAKQMKHKGIGKRTKTA